MSFDAIINPGGRAWFFAGDILNIPWIDHDPVWLLVHKQNAFVYSVMSG
jgi:hypothetical protein